MLCHPSGIDSLAGVLWGIKLVFLLKMLALFKGQLADKKCSNQLKQTAKLHECLQNFETFHFLLISTDMLIFLHQYRSSKSMLALTNLDIQIRMIF